MRHRRIFLLLLAALGVAACSELPTESTASADPVGPAVAGDVTPTSCLAGTYLSSGTCVPADPGYYVDADGAVAETACLEGEYQPDSGATSCLVADPGFFVNVTGAEAQSPCPMGRYQPSSGATSCLAADAGYFVDTVGAEAETKCGLGTYQPNPESTSCLLADAGYYVDVKGAVSETPCPAGYTSDAGASACVPENTPPSVDAILGPVDPVAVGTAVDVRVQFTDPDETDTHTALIDWGDGAETAGTSYAFSGGDGTFDGSHVYAAAGVYTVEVSVEDQAGGVGTLAYQYVVVYDPSAGFTTGAGMIDSPAGAYTHDPSATGRAHFGFNSRYKKGKSTPSGTTQFRFHAAGMDFQSDVQDWLVVNQGGTNAQFKGSGSINGAGSYQFMIWASDDSPDTFRIKIWQDDGGVENVVYDNGVQQAISAGNIKIHSH